MKIILFVFTVLVLFSCNSKDKDVPGGTKTEASESPRPNSNTTSTSTSGANRSAEVVDTNKIIYGFYTGEFLAVEYDDTKEYTYSNIITVSIDSVVGSMLYGHSIVAGNDRTFKGMYEYKNAKYTADVTEPGDDKYDGDFSFTIDQIFSTR